jgi:hypothetical protein
MENNKLAWLCSELGLAAVVESERGVVANRAAVMAGCELHPHTLEVALSALLRTPRLTPTVLDALARARAGETAPRCSHPMASARLLSTGGCALEPRTCAGRDRPESASASLEVQRRASLVDVAAAVSHEVANAVGAIAGWAQLASSRERRVRRTRRCA